MKVALLSMLAVMVTPAMQPETPFPSALAAAFKAADRSIQQVAVCMGPEAAYESMEIDALDKRLDGFSLEAIQTWGGDEVRTQQTQNWIDNQDLAVDCDAADISTLLHASGASLDTLGDSLNDHLAAFDDGIWMGTVSLCRGNPVKTELAEDSFTGLDVLDITLDGPAVAELARLTEASVDHRLALRVNGEVVITPSINEPLLGGKFQIAGPDTPELERIAALLAQCATPSSSPG